MNYIAFLVDLRTDFSHWIYYQEHVVRWSTEYSQEVLFVKSKSSTVNVYNITIF